MNKIVIGLALAIALLSGCGESPKNENGVFVAHKSGKNSWSVNLVAGSSSWDFNYIEVDGHEYLVMHGVYRSGLTHSPKCKCQPHIIFESPNEQKEPSNHQPVPVPLEYQYSSRPCLKN